MFLDTTWQDNLADSLAGRGGYSRNQWRSVASSVSHLAARDEIMATIVTLADQLDPTSLTIAYVVRAFGGPSCSISFG